MNALGYLSKLFPGSLSASTPTLTADPAQNPQAQPPATDTARIDPVPLPGEPPLLGPVIDQEFGVSQESYFTRFELQQYSPDELITKKGFKIFERMYTDDQIHLAITALKLMRLSKGFEVVEASQDKQDIEIADFVADVFVKIEGGLTDVLFNIMGSLEMGWSVNEKIWGFYLNGPYGPSPDRPTGMVRLKALHSKNPQWYNPAVDDFNNITGVVMISAPAFGRKLPADKFLVYSFMKRYGNVFGVARTRALYNWWWIKQVTQRAMGVFIEKYGHPIAVGKYTANMSDADRSNFRTILQQLKITSSMTMPDGASVDFLDMMTKGNVSNFLSVIEKCDQQIVKVIMGQTMSSGTSSAHTSGAGGGAGGSSGSTSGRGGAMIAMDVLEMYLEFIGNHVSQGPMAMLIKEIVDFNFSGVHNYPTFIFNKINEQDLSKGIETWIKAATALVGGQPTGQTGLDGKPIMSGGTGLVSVQPEDEERIREILGMPALQGKSPLRKSRYINKIGPATIQPRILNPQELPWGGYRPPTPSGAGEPANYAERVKKSDPGDDFKLSRKLTKYEGRTDFAEAWRIMDTDGEDAITQDAAKVIHKAVKKVLDGSKKLGGDTAKIKKLTLPYRAELAATLREGMDKVARSAVKQARAEIGEAKAKKFDDTADMTPQEVLDYINDKTFTMSGDISDEVLKRIKMAMYQGVKRGESYQDIVYRVEDAIAPYIDTTQTDEELSGSRLATAIRTAVAEAFNMARKAYFELPELNGFVLAYQFSAVMDNRTTDWCENMDGRIFKVSNPIWDVWTPPTWYNCRSVLIAITKVDGWDGMESAPPRIPPPMGFN